MMQRLRWKAKAVISSVPRRTFNSTAPWLGETKSVCGEKRNPFGIALISDELNRILFGDVYAGKDNKEKLKEALDHLKSFNVNCHAKNESSNQNLNFQLPNLSGNIDSHFFKIGQNYIQPYLELAQKFIDCSTTLPSRPQSWIIKPGWTRYNTDGTTTSVPGPLENVFCFDVEVCVLEGHLPVMATALTPKAWYSWCSEYLVDPERKPNDVFKPDHLVPIRLADISEDRLVIGHNVSYDRARSSEEYDIKQTRTRFLDTMALHIVVNGMTSGQRMQKTKKDPFLDEEAAGIAPKWLNETSLNNLSDVYQLYCKKGSLEKHKRNIFVEGNMDDIRSDVQNLMSYCANDVSATYEIFQQVFPLFRFRCPHPVTLAGMLEMGSTYLPIDVENWQRYISQSDFAAQELEEEVERTLAQQAKETCQLLLNEKHKTDLWMWDQDWKCTPLRMKKGSAVISDSEFDPALSELDNLARKFAGVMETVTLMYKKQQKMPGYPGWYQLVCDKEDPDTPDPSDLGLTKAVIPKLLRINWMGYPLHRHKTEKWGYIVPKNILAHNDYDLETEGPASPTFPTQHLIEKLEKLENFKKNFETIDDDLEEFFVRDPEDKSGFREKTPKAVKITEGIELPEVPGCMFIKLPHKDGKELRVGNPLSKSFSVKVRDGVISTELGYIADKVLKAGKTLSYWRSSRDRILNQMVVSTSDRGGVIIPHLVTAGTLTRRAVERTWLTASNAKADRIGSELKCLVQAPEGYSFVGADVDSQELWIAAVFGDSHFAREHGCTALGWMTLQGTKAEGTDMHSKTAKLIGVSRDEAKVLNYGRIYGAGVPFAKQLLQTFNPTLSEMEAGQLASKMYSETKGEKVYKLNKFGALCHLLNQENNSSLNDLESFIGQVIDRKSMNAVVRTKRKLKNYFEPLLFQSDDMKFQLNDLGTDIAYNILDTNESNTLQFEDCRKIIKSVSRVPAKKDNSAWNDDIKELISKTQWKGGSESYTFNRLEDIALDWHASTPVLGNRLSRVLETEMVGDDYLPSRINWVVQSSAVDYLHLLLVSMHWLCEAFNIDARFAISIHDEVRYLVKSEDQYRAGLALQISNLLVRSMFCHQLGIKSLPRDVAFFSGVDFDKVMRKDPTSECRTPSNPTGLTFGYGISLGQCLTMEEIIKKTNGSLQ